MQITFELKEMSPAEKRAFWKRYVNSVRRVLFNIFAPCVCLTLLTWLIPTIGKPYWGSDSKWTKNNVKLKRDLAVSAAEDLCGGIPSLR
jgi:hypothetical protein